MGKVGCMGLLVSVFILGLRRADIINLIEGVYTSTKWQT